jgi:type II secretory pathway pseudopilin PulG
MKKVLIPTLPSMFFASRSRPKKPSTSGITLVESMVALMIFATVTLGFLATFLQSRKSTENNVMHSAVTAFVYGMMEQIKGANYTDQLPSYVSDPDAPSITPPLIRLHVNQDQAVWLRVRDQADATSPAAPTSTPASTSAGSSVGSHPDGGAIDNLVDIPLSTVSGTASQRLRINFWIWIDNLSDTSNDALEVKRVTIIYTYSVNMGGTVKTFRKREVLIRTRFDK